MRVEDFRCLWRLGPPLTISNREVKPTSADGTALLRVGEYVDASFSPVQLCWTGLFGLACRHTTLGVRVPYGRVDANR